MKKYFTVFKISLQNALEYRLNFWLSRARNVILILTLYFLWTKVFTGKTELFGFSQEKILTYVLGANILTSFVLKGKQGIVVLDIAEGGLSRFLIKPINYFFYIISREWADRFFYLSAAFLETVFLIILFKIPFFLQKDFLFLASFLFILFLSLTLYSIIDFLVGIFAFWLFHAYGPRFAFELAIEFLAGRFFPLNILPKLAFSVFKILPFSFLIFFPLDVYLGRIGRGEIIKGIFLQVFWIGVFTIVTRKVWDRGLRVYSSVGG